MSVREKLDYIKSAFGVAAPNIGHNSEAFMEEQFEERMVWTIGGYWKDGTFGLTSSQMPVFDTEQAAYKAMLVSSRSFGPFERTLSYALSRGRLFGVAAIVLINIDMKEVERWPIK